jgi:hypothetical protein
VVDEVVGEPFVKHREISLALDLFRVEPYHCLDGLGVSVGWRRRRRGLFWAGHCLASVELVVTTKNGPFGLRVAAAAHGL